MQDIIAFVRDNAQQLLAIWGAVVVLATLIVKITPSQKDDALLAKVVKFFDNFSVVNPKDNTK